MRRRLKNFLPIVLVALAVQIFAPIAACCAAGIAASDPLVAAAICHGNGATGAGQVDQTGLAGAEKGCCGLCGMLQAGAAVGPPRTAAAITFERRVTVVAWQEFTLDPASTRAGSPEQARAPPTLS